MMRPDEQANAAEVERDQNVRKSVSKGIGLAGGAIGARVLPLLSEYVPVDLAMRGLQKVAPKVADFLKKGQSAGLNIKEGMDFIKDQFSSQEEGKASEAAQDKRNLIEKYSPELHQFITDKIKSGQSHLGAGALAELEKKGGKDFRSIIEKIKKDTKSTWAEVLDSVYGGAQAAPAAQMQPNQPPGGQNPATQQAPQQQRQAGQGQQALMDILSKINQRLGQ